MMFYVYLIHLLGRFLRPPEAIKKHVGYLRAIMVSSPTKEVIPLEILNLILGNLIFPLFVGLILLILDRKFKNK